MRQDRASSDESEIQDSITDDHDKCEEQSEDINDVKDHEEACFAKNEKIETEIPGMINFAIIVSTG